MTPGGETGSTVEGTAVTIRYRRPPGRIQVFEQIVLERCPDCVVTFLEHSPLSTPMVLNGRIVLENGSPVVWFTFPGAWHDIGRFHRTDGTFTGIYANILRPVEGVRSSQWETTDLFLDVWFAEGRAELLDADELDLAVARGWVGPETAERAHNEAAWILRAARRGEWPPPIVHEWTLTRARAARPPHPDALPERGEGDKALRTRKGSV